MCGRLGRFCDEYRARAPRYEYAGGKPYSGS
jgi:hypothetical protein